MLALSFVMLISICSVKAETMPVTAKQSTQIVWQKTPIPITLSVGQTQLVSFPETVKIGVNRTLLPATTLEINNADHTVYFLAKQAFTHQRIEAKLVPSRQVILLDIEAKAQTDHNAVASPPTPIDIIVPQTTTSSSDTATTPQTSSLPMNYMTLTRFAIQQLYAPKRLLPAHSSIQRFPMATQHVMPLFWDDSAIAMPFASWQAQGLYVTAVLIKNNLNTSLNLYQTLKQNPKYICGMWKAVTFYPRLQLAAKPTSDGRDTTTLFFVSTVPFNQAIKSCHP